VVAKWSVYSRIGLAEREVLTSTALILPNNNGKFLLYYQRYQSLATVAHSYFTSILGKSNRAYRAMPNVTGGEAVETRRM
jgi:hypothetical protein